jgi:uncharacterized protein
MPARVLDAAELADLARRGDERRWTCPVRDLPRVAAVADPGRSGTLAVTATFVLGADGLPRVRLVIGGELWLTCQRCLEPVAWPVDLDAELTVVPDEAQADRLADSIDAVAMTPEGLALAVLAEDEVLAALPLAPTHAGNDGCAAPGNTPAASGGPNRPFAGLASLLKHDASGDD